MRWFQQARAQPIKLMIEKFDTFPWGEKEDWHVLGPKKQPNKVVEKFPFSLCSHLEAKSSCKGRINLEQNVSALLFPYDRTTDETLKVGLGKKLTWAFCLFVSCKVFERESFHI